MPLLVGVALLVAGCGSNDSGGVPVHGEVFFDGQPATEALVVLHPVDPSTLEDPLGGMPYGIVAEDGSVEITAQDSEVGVPVGQFKVAITWPVPAPGSDPDDSEPETVDRLGGRWADPNRTELTVNVQPPETEMPRIELD